MHIHVNAKPVDIDRRERISVHDLFNKLDLGIPHDRVEVQVNGEHIDPSKWLKYGVEAHDEVKILTRQPTS